MEGAQMAGPRGLNYGQERARMETLAPARMFVRGARNGYVLEVSTYGNEPDLWIAASAAELGKLVQSLTEASESALSSRGEP